MRKDAKKSSSSAKVVIIRNTFPQFYGGGETYQLTLSSLLSAHSYHPIIFSSSEKLLKSSKQSKISCQRAPFLKFQNWSGLKNLLLPFYFLWQLYLYFWYRHQFKKLKPITVIIESRDDFLAATLAAKKLGIQTLWIDHMDFRSWVLQNVEQKYKNLIGKHILKVARMVDRIIFISDYERQFFEKLIKKTSLPPFQNLITIKNGAIDTFSEYQTLPVIPKSLIYLGRLEDYKGIKELIAAFQEISSNHQEATLHIYGAGPLADYCKQHQNSQIIYHGFSDQPLAKVASAEIFVLPSYIEGLSLALIDAAMLQKAIITTNVDGNPEVVQDSYNGLLVPAKDQHSLAKAIDKLLQNPALTQEFAKASRIKYLHEFDFAKTVKEQLIPIIEGKDHV